MSNFSKNFNKQKRVHYGSYVYSYRFLLILLLLATVPITLIAIRNPKEILNQTAADVEDSCTESQFYFKSTCRNITALFGQPNYVETAPDTISANAISHASGLIVYKNPNGEDRLYVVDTGNNRILGFSSVKNNTPNIVIGQPSFNTGACNWNNIKGVYLSPTNKTLCLIDYPDRTNVAEYWMRTHVDVYNGNLYVPDVYNNRVLMFKDPINTDTIADYVWGQKDFNTNGKNRNGSIDSNTLYIGGPNVVSTRGISVDRDGNLWVADTYNSRVLRFPKSCENSVSDCKANLVLGQANFTSVSNVGCSTLHTLNLMCHPTIVKVNPENGDVYVVDEFEVKDKIPFEARILVFAVGSLKNGVSAARELITSNPNFELWDDYGRMRGFINQITGLEFNRYRVGSYANGLLWLNEHQLRRTVLVDASGVVIKTINGTLTSRGQAIYNPLGPGGSLGFDKEDNIYFADEDGYAIESVSLKDTDFNNSNPTRRYIFPRKVTPNTVSGFKTAESGGAFSYESGNQLIVRDHERYLVWTDYLNRPLGSKASFVVGQTSDTVRNPNFISRDVSSRSFHAVDDNNVMWAFGARGYLFAYKLPLAVNGQPINSELKLYWKDDQSQVSYNHDFNKGITFDNMRKALWITDNNGHRVLRISNYKDVANSNSKLLVDMVIGQPNKSTTGCNNNQVEKWVADGAPNATNMCRPTGVEVDKLGNLYVIDNDYECHGNNRITVFMKNDIDNANGVLFPNIAAKKVFVSTNFEQRAQCNRGFTDQPASPVDIAFNSKNNMVIGNDGYYGDAKLRSKRQLWFYEDPLKKTTSENYLQGQKPDSFISVPVGAVGEISFDSKDRLIVQDHTWPRVLVLDLDGNAHDENDNVVPTVNVVRPNYGDTISSTVTVETTASDNVGVTSHKILFDNTGNPIYTVKDCGATTSCTYTFDVNSLDLKQDERPEYFVIVVEARDAKNNLGRKWIEVKAQKVTPPPPQVIGPSKILSPSNNSNIVLPVTFSWEKSSNASEYHLYLSSTVGQKDYFTKRYTDSVTSALISSSDMLKSIANNSTVYVRLWTNTVTVTAGNWKYNDYTYKFVGGDIEDKIAPTVDIINPSKDSVVSGVVTIRTTASDNVGVTSHKILFDNTGNPIYTVKDCGTATSCTYTLDVNSLNLKADERPEHFVIVVEARDAKNNLGRKYIEVRAQKSVQVDTTAPSVTITTPSNGATVSGSVSINVNASDNVGVTSIDILVDGNKIQNCGAVTSCATVWNTASVINAIHTITAQAYDAKSNKGSVAIGVDVNNPVVSDTSIMVNPANNSMISFPVEFRWQAATPTPRYYAIYVGTAANQYDLYSNSFRGNIASLTLNKINLKKSVAVGSKIYVKLWTNLQSGSWKSNSYVYTVR